MDLELRDKITLAVAKIIWDNELSIDDFNQAIKGQDEVIYGIIQGWSNNPKAQG